MSQETSFSDELDFETGSCDNVQGDCNTLSRLVNGHGDNETKDNPVRTSLKVYQLLLS